MKEGKKKNKESVWQVFWKQRYLQMFVLLGVVYVLIFNYAPMVGLIIGFKDYKITGGLKGMFTSQWVGLKYFKEFLRNINFRS